jgi:hypothetical protein
MSATPNPAAGAPAPARPPARSAARTTSRERNFARIKLTPEQKAQEKPGLNRHWRTYFLEALAERSNVRAAAAVAGIDPSRAYKVRRKDIGFARQWSEALCEGYENLELEMLQRMRDGEDRDGPRFDNAAALRLLALHRESVARERALRDSVDTAAIRASIDARLDEVRERVLARRAEAAANSADTEAAP